MQLHSPAHPLPTPASALLVTTSLSYSHLDHSDLCERPTTATAAAAAFPQRRYRHHTTTRAQRQHSHLCTPRHTITHALTYTPVCKRVHMPPSRGTRQRFNANQTPAPTAAAATSTGSSSRDLAGLAFEAAAAAPFFGHRLSGGLPGAAANTCGHMRQ